MPIRAAGAGTVRANMTADGLHIYDQFVRMLSTFDKVRIDHNFWPPPPLTCAAPIAVLVQSVMLDLVEDALKDAHDQSLLADWRPLR